MRLFLAGDVMTGRGIDQIQKQSCRPDIYESVARSARDYVYLAQLKNGRIPQSVDPAYVWGDALEILAEQQPALRIINLETSVTTAEEPALKSIHYRMHPDNVRVLQAAAIDCCMLANNHVLDWGEAGLLETLAVLERSSIAVAGAGRTADAAQAPALLCADAAHRVLVFALGAYDSGIPGSWQARADRPGIHFLTEFSAASVEHVARLVHAVKRPDDVAIASLHWGDNWGYDIPAPHRRFAHDLIDSAAIDLVYGHSSHHAKAIEVYRNHLILYGCGDFINDYEGIEGMEEYRGDLVLMYLPDLNPDTGELIDLTMHALQMQRFRLRSAGSEDAQWLRSRLERISEVSFRLDGAVLHLR